MSAKELVRSGLLSLHSFATWFAPTRGLGYSADGSLVIRVPTRLFVQRLEKKYRSQIEAHAGAVEFVQAPDEFGAHAMAK